MSIRPERNNNQFQPITTILRNIIRDYQAGGGVLLELCQNADDAGASKVEFLLDRTEYETKNILHNGLAEYQGVSLLAYNNSTFTDDDFESLRKIGDSGKAEDRSLIGKFGRGFNSVYNWTDSPSIVSGSSLLILDPHHGWSATPEVGSPGGPLYDFVKHSHEPRMKNQLSAYKRFLHDVSAEFDGTIIRLPLRTKPQAAKSKIVPVGKHTPVEEVIEVFRVFSGELVKSLLFLKNVNSITLRIDDEIYAQATSEFVKLSTSTNESLSANARKKKRRRENKNRDKAEVNTAYQRVYVEELDPSRQMDFIMNISLQDKDNPAGNKRKLRYAISHVLAQGPEDQELQAWASMNKLFAWTAIAAPLQGDTGFTGSLFSTLPLPIQTNHPVHIHGMFSITPDRLRLHSGGDWTTSRDSEANLGTKWNQWLFSNCVPRTWIRSLEFLRGLSERGEYPFSAWEFWPSGSDEEWKERGTRVLGDVFERVVTDNLRLLPTVCQTAEARQNILFTIGDIDGYESAFEEAGAAIVVVPQDKRFELERLRSSQEARGEDLFDSLAALIPSSLRTHLSMKDDLGNLSPGSRMLLLNYILSDNEFGEIGLCHAPLIPVMDETFESFKVPSGEGYSLFLARDDNESQLFSQETRAVDTSQLVSETVYMMRQYIDEFHRHTRIKMWTISDAARYCQQHIFNSIGSEDTDIISEQGLGGFVDEFWNWIRRKYQHTDSSALSPLHSLWLIPLMNGDYYRVRGAVPVLDVSDMKGIGAFLWKTADSQGLTRCTLYTGTTSSQQTKEYLRGCGFIKDYQEIVPLMQWLDANSSVFIDQFSTPEKNLLLRYLHDLARDCIGKQRTKSMKDTISKLRVFREAAGLEAGKRLAPECNRLVGAKCALTSDENDRNWISIDKVDSQHHRVKYVGVKDIPVALKAPDTVFIDIKNDDTMNLVKLLNLATCPGLEEILECYVVPEILNSNSGDGGSRRITLIEYALKNFGLLWTKSIEGFSRAKIVPVQGPLGTVMSCPRDTLDPRSPVATLFFPDEGRVGDENFCTRFHCELLQLGMVTSVNADIVLERISEYGKGNRALGSVFEKAQQLITICRNPPNLPLRLHQLRWIPVKEINGTDGLSSASDCRDGRLENLVKHVMPIVPFQVSGAWTSCLGWDQTLPPHVILQQLKGAVKADDTATLYFLIQRGYITAHQFPDELTKIDWIPSTTSKYYSPGNIYSEDLTSLSPHFGTLNPRFQDFTKQFFSKIGVQPSPSFKQLKELQDGLAGRGVLERSDLEMAVRIAKEVGKRYSRNENLHDFKAPDRVGNMRLLSELTAGDPGSQETDLKIMHPGIPLDTAKQLGLATFRDRYLELLNDPYYETEFAQKGSPKTIIDDVLRRYSIDSTFGEYLVNAEDCGSASTIVWIIDDSDDYPTTGLLSPGLADFQGPALFCYNDGTFSEKDFAGIIDIGTGSKQDDPSKIGKFGRGALTMYHWTSVPSFISQDYFVIFDPEQKYLPEHPITKIPRAGMKINIKDVRAQWPGQLQPFEGISRFSRESTSFQGTLFRFPLPRSKSKAKINIPEVRRHLETYYEEANISLLFLKNITSITFFDKHKKLPNWSVRSTTDHKIENLQISHITTVGKYPRPSQAPGHPVLVSRNWCVISGRRGAIPKPLFKFMLKERLEANYGLAALLSETVTSTFRPRNFSGIPLHTPENSRLPVHVNADVILHNNRQSIPLAQREEGSVWNRWILETGVAPLYLDLVNYLMKISGENGYHYWPRYQPQSPETVSKIIATGFWDRVPSSTYNLYPPDRLLSSRVIHHGQSPKNLCLGEATFNLLDTAQSDFFRTLLLKLGLTTVTTPNEIVQNGLREIQPLPIDSVTPEFLLNLFRSAPANSDRLLEIWAQDQDHSISFLDRLLDFIMQGGFNFSLLIDCALLPLANDTLGRFLPHTADLKYLIAETSDERKILEITENRMVHYKLKVSIAKKLASCNLLNVRRFRFEDIIELYPTLELEGKDTGYRKEWLARVWSYLNAIARNSPATEKTRLVHLQNMKICFGKVVGEPLQDVFLCPSEFNNGLQPAILEPVGLTREEMALIESLKGLILLDRSAFPESQIRQESLRDAIGSYRLLASIAILASNDGSIAINTYITKAVHPKNIATLRGVYTPQIISEMLRRVPGSKELLKKLPLWPASNRESPIHRPATDAMLPPYPDLSHTGMTAEDIFIDSGVAKKYREQLASLNVGTMALDSFLRDHVCVFLDRKIPENKITYYESLIKRLADVCPAAFREYALGVDGDDKFRMLSSLYAHDIGIFEAAFRHRTKTHFLRISFRRFPAWKGVSPLVQTITQRSYLACAHAIQQRETEPGAQDDSLISDARTVYEYLCYDDREMGSWSSKGWRDLSNTSFVPAKTDFTDLPHRISKMKRLLGGRRLVSMAEAILPDYVNCAWSQYPVLERPPSPVVLRNLPNLGLLPADTVLNHLVFLSTNRNKVSATQIPAYVTDIREAYRFLQDNPGPVGELSVPPTADIWFNADESEVREMKPEAFQACWICSQNICIGLEYDSPPLRKVGTFLKRYEGLMDYCGVKKLKAAVIPDSLDSGADHQSLFRNGFQRLRNEGRSFDIKLVLRNEVFYAHCAVLCAVSGFWNVAFGPRMGEAEKTYTFPPDSKIKPVTVSALLDYIYTGNVLNIQFSGIVSEDLSNVLDQLNLSHQWQLHELKAGIEINLCKKYWIRPEFVRTILKEAESVRAETLVGICKQYISDNKDIFERPGFAVLS